MNPNYEELYKEGKTAAEAVDRLDRILTLLRSPEGCPWDREQTHSSIRRNFLEETYEVLDAIDTTTPAACARSWATC